MCCKDVGAVKNRGEETGYLTPIRRDTGAIPKSTVQSRVSDVAANVELSTKREVINNMKVIKIEGKKNGKFGEKALKGGKIGRNQRYCKRKMLKEVR